MTDKQQEREKKLVEAATKRRDFFRARLHDRQAVASYVDHLNAAGTK
jgi:hypothetical protein